MPEYFDRSGLNDGDGLMPVISNPQNPSGQTRSGEELRELIEMAERSGNGILLDEAYEMFHSPSVSGIEFVQDLDNSNVFIAGACTKGLQAPGIRIGWMIASKTNIETMANYSSFGMGVSATLHNTMRWNLLEPNRVKQARQAVEEHYNWQRRAIWQGLRRNGTWCIHWKWWILSLVGIA